MFGAGIIFEDGRWGWKHSFSGEYTVRSGYAEAYKWRMSKAQGGGESSNWEDVGRTWTKFWKSKVPEGVKLLGWRVFRNAIPAMFNLFRRGVVQSKKCSVCGYKEESVEHVFMACWWATNMWQCLNIDVFIVRGGEHTSISEWLWRVFTEESSEVMRKVLIGLYLIWGNRNALAHGKEGWSATLSALKVNSLITQLDHQTLLGFSHVGLGERIAKEGWEVFCDGSWSGSRRRAGWAAIISRDNIIMECRTEFAEEVSGIQSELNAILLGFHLVAKYGGTSVRIYSDCATVIWTLQKGARHMGLRADSLAIGCRLLEENPGWKIMHIFRSKNYRADLLAKKARVHGWKWDREDALPFVVEGGNEWQ